MNADRSYRGAFVALTTAALFLLAGCEATTAPETEDVTSEDAEAIASLLSEMDVLALGSVATATTSGTRSFSRSAPCPAGGSVSLSGTAESSADDATGVVSTSWSNTKVQAACAVTRTRGEKSLTVVVDGTVTSAGTSSWQRPETRGGSRALLSWSSTTVGSTTTTVGDQTRTCAVDLKQTWDPATQKFTITGALCGRQIATSRIR